MVDLESLIRALTEHRVDFIVIGGVAATIHGSARLTQDLDVVYSRKPENIARLVAPSHPTHRTCGAPRLACHSAGTRPPCSTGSTSP